MVDDRDEQEPDEKVIKPNRRNLIDRLLMRPVDFSDGQYKEKKSDKDIYTTSEPSHLEDVGPESENKQRRFHREASYSLFGNRQGIGAPDQIDKYTDVIPKSLTKSRLDQLKEKLESSEKDNTVQSLTKDSATNTVASVNKNTKAAHSAVKTMLNVNATMASAQMGYRQADIADRTYRFLRTTVSSYMTRNLALKYQQIFQMRDMIRSSVRIGRILEAKLEAIKLNTGATELDKRSLSSIISDKFSQDLAGFVTDKANKLLFDPLENKATSKTKSFLKGKVDDLSQQDGSVGSIFQKIKGLYPDEFDQGDPTYSDVEDAQEVTGSEGTGRVIELLTDIRNILRGDTGPSTGPSGGFGNMGPSPSSPTSGPQLPSGGPQDLLTQDKNTPLPPPRPKAISGPDGLTSPQSSSADTPSMAQQMFSPASLSEQYPKFKKSREQSVSTILTSQTPSFRPQHPTANALPEGVSDEETSPQLPAVKDETDELDKEDLETSVGDRLDKMYNLIDGFFNRRDEKAKSQYLDRDKDNLRDNSYRDYFQDKDKNTTGVFDKKMLAGLAASSKDKSSSSRTYGSQGESDEGGMGFWEYLGMGGAGVLSLKKAAGWLRNKVPFLGGGDTDDETKSAKPSTGAKSGQGAKAGSRLGRVLKYLKKPQVLLPALATGVFATSGDGAEASEGEDAATRHPRRQGNGSITSLEKTVDRRQDEPPHVDTPSSEQFRQASPKDKRTIDVLPIPTVEPTQSQRKPHQDDQASDISARSPETPIQHDDQGRRIITTKKNADFRDQVVKGTPTYQHTSSEVTSEDTSNDSSKIPAIVAGTGVAAGLGFHEYQKSKEQARAKSTGSHRPGIKERATKKATETLGKTRPGQKVKTYSQTRAGQRGSKLFNFGKKAIGPLDLAYDTYTLKRSLDEGNYRSAALAGLSIGANAIPYVGIPLSIGFSLLLRNRREGIAQDRRILKEEGPLFKARLKLYGVPDILGSARGPIRATSELEEKLYNHMISENDFMADDKHYKDCIKHLGLRASNPNEFEYALKWARVRVQMIFMTYLRILKYVQENIPGFEDITYENETAMSEPQRNYVIRELTKQTDHIVREYKDIVPTRTAFDKKYGSRTSRPGGAQGGLVDTTDDLVSKLDTHVQSIKPVKADTESHEQLKRDEELAANADFFKSATLPFKTKEKELAKPRDPEDVSASIDARARESGVIGAGFIGAANLPSEDKGDTEQIDKQGRRIIAPKKGVDFRDQVIKGTSTTRSDDLPDAPTQQKPVQYDDQGRPIIKMTSDTRIQDLKDTVTSVAAHQRSEQVPKTTTASRQKVSSERRTPSQETQTPKPQRISRPTETSSTTPASENINIPDVDFYHGRYVTNPLSLLYSENYPEREFPFQKNALFNARYRMYGFKKDTHKSRHAVNMLEQELYKNLKDGKSTVDERVLKKYAVPLGFRKTGREYNNFIRFVRQRIQLIFSKYLGMLSHFRDNVPEFKNTPTYENETDIPPDHQKTIITHFVRQAKPLVKRYQDTEATGYQFHEDNASSGRPGGNDPTFGTNLFEIDASFENPSLSRDTKGDAFEPKKIDKLPKRISPSADDVPSLTEDTTSQRKQQKITPLKQHTLPFDISPQQKRSDEDSTVKTEVKDVDIPDRDYYVGKYLKGPLSMMYRAVAPEQERPYEQNELFNVRYKLYGFKKNTYNARHAAHMLEKELYKSLKDGKGVVDENVLKKYAVPLGFRKTGREYNNFIRFVRQRVQLIFAKYLGMLSHFRENIPGFEDMATYDNEINIPLDQQKTIITHFVRQAKPLVKRYRDTQATGHEFHEKNTFSGRPGGNDPALGPDLFEIDASFENPSLSRDTKGEPLPPPSTRRERDRSTSTSDRPITRRMSTSGDRRHRSLRRTSRSDTRSSKPTPSTDDTSRPYQHFSRPDTVNLAEKYGHVPSDKSKPPSPDTTRPTLTPKPELQTRDVSGQRSLPDHTLGEMSAQYESSQDGSMAIGYDRNGGTSYGKYQLATKPGTFGRFLGWLKKQPDPGPTIAKRLTTAGNPNTGSQSGAVPKEWRKIVREGLMGDFETQFIKATHYDVALQKLPPKMKSTVQKTAALKDVLWSTAVQHGPSAAKSIFVKTHEHSPDTESWIQNIYDRRKTQFTSSTSAVQKAVANRFDNEMQVALSTHRETQDPQPDTTPPQDTDTSSDVQTASRSPQKNQPVPKPSPSDQETSPSTREPRSTAVTRSRERITKTIRQTQSDVSAASQEKARLQDTIIRPASSDTSYDDYVGDADVDVPDHIKQTDALDKLSADHGLSREVTDAIVKQTAISKEAFADMQHLLKAIKTALESSSEKDDVGHDILATLKEQLGVQKELREITPTVNMPVVQASGQQSSPPRRSSLDMSLSKAPNPSST